MKFLPLILAGLLRKPLRTGLTFLSAGVAFTLFGLMFGLNANVRHAIAVARLDCIFTWGRFGDNVVLAQREHLLKLPHVRDVGYWTWLGGYYRDPKNSAGVLMLDPHMHRIWHELPLSDAQFEQLRTTRTGIFMSQSSAARLKVKTGDIFPLLTQTVSRQDGGNLWPLKILGVFPDLPTDPEGLIIGDYSYMAETRPLMDRGKVDSFETLVDDPRNAAAVTKAIDLAFANSGHPTRSISEKGQYETATLSGIDVSDISAMTIGTAAASLFMMLFLIGNALAQSVRERVPEFAVMRALGFSQTVIIGLIVTEAVVPTMLAAACGLLLAASLTPLWPALIPSSWAIPAPAISPPIVAFALAAAAAMAGLCAMLPSLRLTRLDLVTALAGRH
jgi:putative ABC transport system permease protein